VSDQAKSPITLPLSRATLASAQAPPIIWQNPTMGEAIDDVVRAPEWAAPTGRRAKPAWPAVALSVSCIYLALDRLSFIEGLHGIGITPWNPSAGLATALLIIKGLGYAALARIRHVPKFASRTRMCSRSRRPERRPRASGAPDLLLPEDGRLAWPTISRISCCSDGC
jgi:hypothetical protein